MRREGELIDGDRLVHRGDTQAARGEKGEREGEREDSEQQRRRRIGRLRRLERCARRLAALLRALRQEVAHPAAVLDELAVHAVREGPTALG
eukprot:1979962-Prymnesium_polylepis.1